MRSVMLEKWHYSNVDKCSELDASIEEWEVRPDIELMKLAKSPGLDELPIGAL